LPCDFFLLLSIFLFFLTQSQRPQIGCLTYFYTWHCSSGRQPNFAALNRGRHLYSAGRPSCWALAHVSTLLMFMIDCFTVRCCRAFKGMERTFPCQRVTVAGQRTTSYISRLSRSFYIELPKVTASRCVMTHSY